MPMYQKILPRPQAKNQNCPCRYVFGDIILLCCVKTPNVRAFANNNLRHTLERAPVLAL